MNDKPPYRVPSLAEIARVPLNGYTVVSTFSGAGGSCLGFRWAGFRIIYASEFVESARETYRANFHFDPDPRDVRQVTGASIKGRTNARRADGEIDVLEGSPPCASFSMAGRREKQWGKRKVYSDGVVQRTDDLFPEFARLLRELRPRVFVAENVPGLLGGVARGYLAEIFESFRAAGYVVKAKVLDAQWLGVPQVRRRVFFVGVREDLATQPIFPTPLPYRYSIRDALPHLSAVRAGGELRSTSAASPTVQTHGNAFTHSELVVVRKTGGHNFKDVERPLDQPISTVMTGSPKRHRTDSFEVRERSADRRARPASLDEPSPTVLAVNSGWSDIAAGKHVDTDRRRSIRKLTIDELKRLCGFPDDFVLTGTYAQQWERLGRAVPPPMAYRVALGVRATLDAAVGRSQTAETPPGRSRARRPGRAVRSPG